MQHKTVKMAVLNDYGLLSDRDKEYAALCVRYNKFFAPIKIRAKHIDNTGQLTDATNLVLYDYGGIMPGCLELVCKKGTGRSRFRSAKH